MPALLFPIACLLLFLLSLSPFGAGFRGWIMAKLYVMVQKKAEPFLAERKRRLFADLSGIVLEIGPGNGVNFDSMPDGVRRWIGIEPNPYMHDQLRKAAAERGIEADFRTGSAQGMQVGENSIDVVVSTHVLCSVPDPQALLHDIHRVLRPGGRFVFIEHVAAPPGSRLRRLQRLAKPFWWYCAGGCRPDRELGNTIRAAEFEQLRIEEFEVPRQFAPAVVSPHVAGVAVKQTTRRGGIQGPAQK